MLMYLRRMHAFMIWDSDVFFCDFLAVWCVFIFLWIDDGVWGDHNAALLGRGSICIVHESTGDVFEIEWPIMFKKYIVNYNPTETKRSG